MVNEKKEQEFANQVELNIKDVSFDMSRDGDTVSKVSFETTDGFVITYKPKKVVETRIRGIKVVKQSECLFDEVTPKVFAISEQINDKGIAKVFANYKIWNTSVDGIPKTYRYVQGIKMMEEWKIIKEDVVKEETITPIK